MSDLKLLGTFDCESGRMRVTDPCYDKEGDSGKVKVVKPGRWVAYSQLCISNSIFTQQKHLFPRALVVMHSEVAEDRSFDVSASADWEEAGGIGVDSGQTGFFDNKKYPEEPCNKENGSWENFYEKCMKATLPDERESVPQFGVLVVNPNQNRAGLVDDFGVASATAYGDGYYQLYVLKKDKRVVAMKVVYMEDEYDLTEADGMATYKKTVRVFEDEFEALKRIWGEAQPCDEHLAKKTTEVEAWNKENGAIDL